MSRYSLSLNDTLAQSKEKSHTYRSNVEFQKLNKSLSLAKK